MPRTDSSTRLWVVSTLALAAVIGAAVAGVLIVASPTWSAGEIQIVEWVHGAQNTVSDLVALTINTVFGPSGSVLVSVIMLAWVLLMTRSWQTVVRVGIVLIVPWTVAEILKAVVQRPRPDPALLQPMIVPDPVTFSYPSGHTAFAAALCCTLLFVVLSGRARAWGTAAVVFVVAVTAWSRVYLGVHYPTDVIVSAIVVPTVALATSRLTARWPLLTRQRRSDRAPLSGEDSRRQA